MDLCCALGFVYIILWVIRIFSVYSFIPSNPGNSVSVLTNFSLLWKEKILFMILKGCHFKKYLIVRYLFWINICWYSVFCRNMFEHNTSSNLNVPISCSGPLDKKVFIVLCLYAGEWTGCLEASYNYTSCFSFSNCCSS